MCQILILFKQVLYIQKGMIVKMEELTEIDYKIIGERIKKARKKLDLTQEQLSEKIDVSVAYLSRVERGNTKINLIRLVELAEVLNVSISYLITGIGINTKDYLNEELRQLLQKCTPAQKKLILNIAHIIVEKNSYNSQ